MECHHVGAMSMDTDKWLTIIGMVMVMMMRRTRFIKRKELGDMKMNAMAFDVPLVESFIKSPLDKLVTIAANNCAYS